MTVHDRIRLIGLPTYYNNPTFVGFYFSKLGKNMITIYGIKNCNTMKKAFEKLDNLGLTYTFFDYKKQQVTIETLQTWVNQAGIDKVLNKKGTTWRNVSDTDKQTASNDINFALQLMQQNPSMIKRPIVVADKTLIVGFDEMAFESL